MCGYLRRFCLVSALTAALAMVLGVPGAMAETVVDPDSIAGNAAIVAQLSPFNTTVCVRRSILPFMVYVLSVAVGESQCE
jgi:hypothetical protein